MSQTSAETREELRAIVRASCSDKRVECIHLSGITYWVKRPEKLPLLLRIRKGNPTKALGREIDGYRALNERGLAAPELVACDRDYFITSSGGISLVALLHNSETSVEERSKALCSAATALQNLHAAGMAHGRPNLKDILWDGNQICFIDFERFGVIRNMRMAQISDLLIFALSCFATARMDMAEIDKALLCYRSADQRGIWQATMRWVRRGRALDWMLRPALQGKRRIRDLRAFSALVQNMIRLDRAH